MATRLETQESAEEVRLRFVQLRETTGKSWQTLALETGVPSGTLGPWAGGKYPGNVLSIAEKVRRYLDGSEALAAMSRGEVADPGYVDTPSGRRFMNLLKWAHTGKIVAIAVTPGVGKTMAATEYRTRAANVFVATISPDCSGVQPMQAEVLAAMGDGEAKGSPQMLTRRILARVRDARALIVIDEAQHLSDKALEVARRWHDTAGVGVALVGDQRVIARLTGLRAQEMAQINSRISMRHVQRGPEAQDAELVASAWGIADAEQLRFLKMVAGKPGALRIMVMVIELAAVLAADAARPVTLEDLQDAWAQLRSDIVAVAA